MASHKSSYMVLKDRLKQFGRTLALHRRAEDGRISYVITHGDQAFHFSHLHDVAGHANALEGIARE